MECIHRYMDGDIPMCECDNGKCNGECPVTLKEGDDERDNEVE